MTKTGGAAQVVEADKLVVFDVPGNSQNQDFKAFVDSLGKPVEAVIISHGDDHHWLGADAVFPGVAMYSLDADVITDEAVTKARQSMGNDMVPYTAAPKVTKLENGARSFDGVEYVFTRLPELQATIIEMPAQKAAMVHHLGYVGVHVPMAPFDQRLVQLEALKQNGYAWIVAGHGTPGDGGLCAEGGRLLCRRQQGRGRIQDARGGQGRRHEAISGLSVGLFAGHHAARPDAEVRLLVVAERRGAWNTGVCHAPCVLIWL